MATTLLQRIPTTPLLFSPVTTDFAGYAKQQLGDLGTNTDGWDAVFNPTAAAVAGDIASLTDLDAISGNIPINFDQFQQFYIAPLDTRLAGIFSTGDAANLDVTNQPARPTAPNIPAPPPPPAGIGKSQGSQTVLYGGNSNDCTPDCGGGYNFWNPGIQTCMNWLAGSESTVSFPPQNPINYTSCLPSGTMFGELP